MPGSANLGASLKPADGLPPGVLLLLLALLGLTVLPHAATIPLPLSAFFFMLLGWRLTAVWRPRLAPSGMANFLLTVCGVGLLLGLHRDSWGREAGAAVFVLALGVKLLELRNKRDIYLICFLAMIVCAALFLFRQSLPMLAYGLALCTGLFGVLAGVNAARPGNQLALRTAAKIVLQALPLAVVIFVLFPRFQPPKWALTKEKNQTQSGLGDTLEPGAISDLLLSKELVFRAKFDGEIPPKARLYWRGPVFSHTDGGVWRLLNHAYVLNFQDRLRFSGPAYRYSVLLEPQSRDWVYALDMPVQFGANLRRNENYQLIAKNNLGEPVEFSILSHTHYNTGYITKTEYRENRQLPGPPSPRLAELARQFSGNEDNPDTFVRNFLAYIRANGFRYTLQPPLMPNNFVETFLFDTRRGFCNHYATAFAYLARVAGIPARVVSGYQGGTLNPVGGFWEIRQANAHIWAEVWMEDKGWLRVDPTAAILPERLEQGVDVERQTATGAFSGQAEALENGELTGLMLARQYLSDFDFHWQRWVVGYNGYVQQQALTAAGIDGWREMGFWILVAIALALLTLAGYLLKRRREPESEAVSLYRWFCRKMAAAGVEIHPGEGPVDFAGRARAMRPEIGAEIDEITGLFVRLRYLRRSSRRDLASLRRKVKAL